MTRLANRHGAINLAQGFPDFDPPEELLAALERATRGPFHQYAVTWGAPRFREALARKKPLLVRNAETRLRNRAHALSMGWGKLTRLGRLR